MDLREAFYDLTMGRWFDKLIMSVCVDPPTRILGHFATRFPIDGEIRRIHQASDAIDRAFVRAEKNKNPSSLHLSLQRHRPAEAL